MKVTFWPSINIFASSLSMYSSDLTNTCFVPFDASFG